MKNKTIEYTVEQCKEFASTKVVIVGDLDTFIKKWDDE